MERGLHQRRVGDRAGHGLGQVGGPSDHDPAHAGRAFAVGDYLERQLAQQRVHRFAEAQLSLGLGFDTDSGGAPCEREDGVARGELTVDADAVKRPLDGHGREEVERFSRNRSVGLHEAEHGREAWRDHAGALGLGGEGDRPLGQCDLQAGPLGTTVRGQDRARESLRVVAQFRDRGTHAFQQRLPGQLGADHARRGHPDLAGLDSQKLRGDLLGRSRRLKTALTVAGVRAAGIGDDRAQPPYVCLTRDGHRRSHARVRGEAGGGDRVGAI